MNKKSFTLVEVLIVIGVLGLMLAAVFEILATGKNAQDMGSTQGDVMDQARQGLESMVKELYQTTVAEISDPSGRPFDNVSTITFQIPVGYDIGGKIIWGDGQGGASGNKITYIVENQQFLRKVYNSSNELIGQRVLANYVQGVGFSLGLKGNLLTITLTVQKAVPGVVPGDRIATQTLTVQVAFRN